MNAAANDDVAVYPRHTLGRVDVEKAVKGVKIGAKRTEYVVGQLIAVKTRDGSPDVARVAADVGRHVKVERFSMYREAWLPGVWIQREEILGEAQ